MSELQWIKLSTHMFEDEKIRLIESIPDADAILASWFKLFLMSSKDRSMTITNFASGSHSNVEFLSILLKRDIDFTEQLIKTLSEVGLMEVKGSTFEIKRFWLTNQEIRNTAEYKQWRLKVFERDKYTCQECGQVGGSLQAHHIKEFARYEELRFVVSNGLTLCEECHKNLHKELRENG